MNDESILDERDAAFIQPAKQWQGAPLAPYTEGARLVWLQAADPADSMAFRVWSLLYVLSRLGQGPGSRQRLLEVAWQKALFREAILAWVDRQVPGSYPEAEKLVTGLLDEVERVSAEPDGKAGPGPKG